MQKFLRTLTLMALMCIPWVAQAQNTQSFDFEDGNVPAGWTNDETHPWIIVSESQGSGHTGTYCLKSGNSGVHSSSSTLSATFTFAGDGSISFLGGFFGEGSSTLWDKCIFSIDGVQQFAYGALQTWETKSFDVESGTHTFTWSFTKDGSQNATGDGFFVDNVVVDLGVAPSCPKPLAIAVSEASANAIPITWTPSGSENAWKVYLYDNDDNPISGYPVDVTTAAYTFTNLAANTPYKMGVATNCGTEVSAQRYATARTACDAIATFPWMENFDSYTGTTSGTVNNLPSCWSYFNACTYSTYQGYPLIYNGGANSGSNSLRFYSYGYSSYDPQDQWVVFPAMDALAGKQITLMAKGYNTTSTFKVGLLSNPEDISTFTEIATQDGLTTSYQEFTYNIPSTATEHYVAIMMEKSTSSYKGVYIDDVTIAVPPSCLKPSALTSVSATAHSATIGWTDGADGYSAWQIAYSTDAAFDPYADGVSIADVTSNPGTVEGLEPSTKYYFYVRANCGDDGYSLWSTGSCQVLTACEAISDLSTAYTCGFEADEIMGTTNAQALPWCWTRINDASGTYSYWPYAYSTYPRTGARDLFFSLSTGATYANNMVAVMPEIDIESLPLSTLRLRFYTRGNYSGVGGDLVVGVMTDPADPTTFTAVETIAVSGTDYVLNTVTGFPDNGAHYIALYMTKGASAQYAYIDDLTLDLAPSCLEITNLAVSDVTSSSITLSWDDLQNTGATYTVYNGQELVATGIAATTYTVTGLAAMTDYTFSVVANCGASDASYPVSVSGRTACVAFETLPYSENFDSYEGAATGTTAPTGYPEVNMPLCWDFLNLSSSSSSYPQAFLTSSTSYAVSGNALFFKSSSTTPLYVVMPEFDVEGALQLLYTYRNEGTSAVNGTILVGVMSNASDATTFVAIDSCERTTTLTEKEVIFSDGLLANGARIAFCYRGGTSNNYYASIDNVTLQLAPTCLGVNDLAAANVSGRNAELSWTEKGEATAWQVCVNGDETNLVDATANPFTLTGLTPETEYTVKVRSNCGSEDGVSQWSGDVTFTTLVACPAPTAVGVSNIGNRTADLSWNESGEATEWQLCVNDDETNLITVTTNPYTLTGLTPETEYTVKVRANCGTDDGVSAWSGNVTFSTLVACPAPAALAAIDSTVTAHAALLTWNGFADSYNVRYKPSNAITEDFEAGSLSDDWTANLSTTSSGVYEAAAHESSYGFRFHYNEQNASLVSPLLDNAGNEVTVSFYYNRYSASYIEHFAVGYTTDATVTDPAEFTYGDEILVDNSVWNRYENTFPAGTKRIAIKYIYTNAYYLFIDDIEISIATAEEWSTATATADSLTVSGLAADTRYMAQVQANCGAEDGLSAWSNAASFTTLPSCQAVTNLVASNVTGTTVDLSWTDDANDDADNYTVSYGETSVVVTGTSTTIENLTPNTAYTFSVVTNCASGVTATASVDVVTLQVPATVPYTSGLENTDDYLMWTRIGNPTNAWYIGSAVSEQGTNSLYVSNDNGVSNAYTNSATSVSYIFRLVNFTEAGWYSASFDWKGAGESTYDYMRVCLVPADVVLPDNNSLYSGLGTTNTPAGWIALDGGSKLNLSNDWTTQTANFQMPAAGQYMLVFVWRNDYGDGNNPPVAVDNIDIHTKYAFAPTAMTATNVTSTGAVLTWTRDSRNNNNETYTVMSGETVLATGLTGNTRNISLTPNTEYTFSVIAVNNGESSDAKSLTVGVYEYQNEPGKMVYVTGTILNTGVANDHSVTLYRGLGANLTEQASYTTSTYLTQNLTTYTASNEWPLYGPMTVVFMGEDATAANTGVANLTVGQKCPTALSRDLVTVEANGAYTWTTPEGAVYSYENHRNANLGRYENGDIVATYRDTVRNAANCDSVINSLRLTLHPDFAIAVDSSVCERDTVTIGTEKFFATGSYPVTLTTVNGADSVVTLTLQVHPAPLAYIYYNNRNVTSLADMCDGRDLTLNARSNMEGVDYTWENASTEVTRVVNPVSTEANLYTLVATEATYGCASLPAQLTVATTAMPALTISGADAICVGQSATLTVNDANNVEATYRWSNGQTGTSITVTPTDTTTYTVTATTTTGNCEVTAEHTVAVNALPVVTVTLSEEALCSGKDLTVTAAAVEGYTYDWGNDNTGNVYSVAPTVNGTTYTVTVTDANSCANTFTSPAVTVYPVYELVDTQSVCYTQNPFSWGTMSLTEGGTYDQLFSTVNSCDSTVHLTFSFEEMSVNNSYRAVCKGTEVTWGDQTVTADESTTLTYDLNSGDNDPFTEEVLDCPARYNLILTVNPVKATSFDQIACDSYLWTVSGQTYDVSGEYPFTLKTTKDCDSVVTMNLTINASNSGVDQQTACDTYTWIDGNTYTESNNTATFTLTNAANCDSVVTLNLTVNYATTGVDFVRNCDSVTYTWMDGETYSLSVDSSEHITHTLDVTNAAGCDSIAVLHLVLNPVTDTLNWVDLTVTDNLMIDVVNCDGTITREYISEEGPVERRTRNTETGRDQWTRINLSITSSEYHTVVKSECVPYNWTPEGSDTTIVLTESGTVSYEVLLASGLKRIEVIRFTAKLPTQNVTEVTLCRNQTWTDSLSVVYDAAQMELGVSDSIVWNTYINAAGCQHEDIVLFTVNPVYAVDSTVVLCESEFTNGSYTLTNANDATQTIELTIPTQGLNETQYTNTVTASWTTAEGCDSTVTVNYTVNPTVKRELTVGACYTYTWADKNNTVYNEFGTVTDTIMRLTHAGCDSIVTLNLTVSDKAVGIVPVVECGRYEYQGVTYLEGTFYDTVYESVPSVNNCDSLTVYKHWVKQRQLLDQVVIANHPYTWVNGQEYTSNTNGVFYNYEDVDGCDSTLVLHFSIVESLSICEGELPYAYQGVTLTDNVNGIYQGTVNDTVYDFVYTLRRNTVDTLTLAACDSAEWHGTVYTTSGNYSFDTINAAGCDSTATLVLTVNASNSGDTTAVECGSFVWNGMTLTTSGDTTFVYTNAANCDSTVTLHLTINPTYNDTIDTAVCDSIVWNNQTYTQSNTYTFQNTVLGCDSTVVLNLTVNNSYHVSDDTLVNAGSFTYNDVLYKAEFDSTFTARFTAANGCDSLVDMHLVVTLNVIVVDTVYNCGDYVWRDGKTYTWVPAEERVNSIINYKERTADGLVSVENYPEMATNHGDGSDTTYILWLTLQEASVEYKEVTVPLSWTSWTDVSNGHLFDFSAEKAAKQSVVKLDTLRSPEMPNSGYFCDSIVYYTFNLIYNYDTLPTVRYLCYGDSLADGKTVDQIFYVDSVANEGTDSTMIYSIKYSRNRELTSSAIDTVCDSLVWNNMTLTESTPDTTYTASVTLNGIQCDSVAHLNLTVTHTIHNTYRVYKCNTYTWMDDQQNGNNETYVRDTIAYWSRVNAENPQCFDVDTLILDINYPTPGTIDTAICQGESFVWNVNYVDMAGEPQVHTEGTFTVDTTATYTLPDGDINGCDSVLTLNLTVYDTFIVDTTYTRFGENWRLNGMNFSAPYDSTVTFNLQTVNSCDSIVHAHVILNNYEIVDTIFYSCGEFTWTETADSIGNDHLYRSITDEETIDGALYKDVTANTMVYTNPLDTLFTTGKIYRLHLNLNGAIYTEVDTTFLVSLDSLVYDDSTFHFGTYKNLASTEGMQFTKHVYYGSPVGSVYCDSVVLLNITLVNNYDTLDVVNVCNEQTDTNWNGKHYTLAQGDNMLTDTLYVGTDTMTVVSQNIKRAAAITGTETIAACDSTTWNDSVYVANVVNEAVTLTAANGCDSVVTLNITITNTLHNVIDTVVCESFTWTDKDNANYTADTVDTWSRANATNANCNDVDTLKLTVHYNSTGIDSVVACDTANWYEHTNLTVSSTSLTHTLVDSNQYGCDSVVTLHLTVNYKSYHDTVVWAGDGSYRFHNMDGSWEMLTSQEEAYTRYALVDTVNAVQCDSIYKFEIHVGNGYFVVDTVKSCKYYTWRNDTTYEWISEVESAAHDSALYKTTTGEYILTNPYYVKHNTDAMGVQNDFDSIYMLRLTLTQDTVRDTIINFPISLGTLAYAGQTFNYGVSTEDSARTFAGTTDSAVLHLQATHYCDSIINLTVNIFNNYQPVDSADICATTTSFTWDRNGRTISTETSDFDHEHVYYIYDTIADADSLLTRVEYITIFQHPLSYATERREACDSYEWNGTVYTESTSAATFDTVDSYGCDSTVTLVLVINHNSSSAIDTTACDTYSWTLANGDVVEQAYTENGEYFYNYTSLEGCPSTDTLRLTVNHSNSYEFDTVVCDNFAWTGVGNYNMSQVINHTFTNGNADGCDSVVTVNLTVNKSNFEFLHDTVVCDSYKWNDSMFYASTSDLEFHVTNVAGCDSTIYMNNLTVVKSGSYAEQTVCDSYTWSVTNETFTQSDVYYNSRVVNNVCGTFTDTLNLTVNYGTYHSDTAVACMEYTWIDNVTYNEEGEHTYIYNHNGELNAAGCPQVDTLHLTIGAGRVIVVDSVVACQPFTWIVNDSVIGTYNVNTLTSINLPNSLTGCDSVVYLVLTMLDEPVAYDSATVCASEMPYNWQRAGYELTQAGDTTFMEFVTPTCSTLVHFNLVVNPTFDVTLTDGVCLGNGYNANGFDIAATELATSGEYTFVDSLTTVNGCDSVVTLTLTVGDIITFDTTVTACDSYTWTLRNGETRQYTQSGSYTETYNNAGGCSTNERLALTINQSQNVTLDAVTACDSYEWNGIVYTASADLDTTVADVNGCDSTTTLSLTINYSSSDSVEMTACTSYEWNDSVYTVSGVYDYTTTNIAGCDSTATLTLTITTADSVAVELTACDSVEWNGTVYSESGVYTYNTVNLAGCDSVVTLTLTVNQSVASEETASACQFYVWNNQAYTESGDYNYNAGTAVNGCDSIVTLHLTINQPIAAAIDTTVCDSYTWNGATYTVTGAYTQSYSSNNGCDSVLTLNLTVRYSQNETLEPVTACDSYEWNDSVYTESAEIVTSGTAVNGCDSTTTLVLTVNHSNSEAIEMTACDSYLWNGTEYTESGVYTVNGLTNVAGCDSSATLTLTINASSQAVDVQTACNSYTWIDGITYTASNNTATYTLTNAAGCDSVVTLNLTVSYATNGSETATACESYEWNGETYTESGVYTFDTVNGAGCDSTVTLTLTVKLPASSVETAIVCDSVEWNGQTYNASGEYTYTTTAANGCDSVATLYLTVNSSSTGLFEATACDNYTWIDGNTYSESNNTATYTLYNANGCDSVITLNLTVNASTGSTTEVTTCVTYEWNGQSCGQSGIYTYTTTNAAGCDSTALLMLTINNTVTSTVSATACDSYSWNGTEYTTSGNYQYTTTALNGCDSVVTLLLTINNSNAGTDTREACDSYTWIDGVTYTESNNTATYTLYNASGCDSVVTLNLTVNYSGTGTESVNTCNAYEWHGQTYGQSGIYTYNGTTVAGCDSTVTLMLVINPSIAINEAATACGSYLWNGTEYTTSGIYTFSSTTTDGCDSIATLILTIKEETTAAEDTAVCGAYAWNGQVYSQSGVYNYTTTGSNGCDSTVTLTLTVNSASSADTAATACTSFNWYGVAYSLGGNYQRVLTNVAGCDSIVTLHLTINMPVNVDIYESTCDSYTWTDGDQQTYTTSGDYNYTTTGANGCDSTTVLHLTISNSASTDVDITAIDSYEWHGTVYTQSGNYTWHGQTVNGCDSTVTLHLTIVEHAPDSVTVTFNVNNAALGSVNPAGTFTYAVGSTVTVTATANEDAFLTGWHVVVNGLIDTTYATSLTTFTLDVTQAMANLTGTVTAVFEANEEPVYFTVTATSADTTMGVVTGSGRYEAGATATLHASAKPGYRFVNWSNGVTDSNYSFIVNSDVTVYAYFERITSITEVDDTFTVTATDSRIVVTGAEGMDIYVYDVNGRMLRRQANAAATEEFTVSATGVYLVKVGNAPAKRVVVVR